MRKKMPKPDKYIEAKEMYMSNISVSQIARHLNINRTTIQSRLKKEGWKLEREKAHLADFNDLMSTKDSVVTNITRDALSAMGRGVNYLSNRAAPPTIDESIKCAKVLEILSKVSPKREISHDEAMLEQFEAGVDQVAGVIEENKGQDENIKDIF